MLGARHDLAEMDVEAVGEEQGLALGHVGLQIVFIERGLDVVLGQDLHHLGLFGRLGGGHRLEAVFHRQLKVGGSRHLGHHHVHAAIPEIQRLGVALGAEADDGHLLPLENPQIRIRIVVHFHG